MQIQVTRQVNAPIDVTFNVFADIPGTQERIDSVKQIEMLSDVEQGVGTRWREKRVMFGREATEEMEISAFQPNQAYEVVSESHGTAYHTRFTFAEQTGGTRVEMVFTSKPMTLTARLMSVLGFLLTGATQKALEADMDDLKAAAEQQTAA